MKLLLNTHPELNDEDAREVVTLLSNGTIHLAEMCTKHEIAVIIVSRRDDIEEDRCAIDSMVKLMRRILDGELADAEEEE